MYYHSSIDNSWFLLITWITLFFRVFKYVLSKLIRIIEVIRFFFFFFNSTHFYKLISRLNSITLIYIKLDPYRSQALQLVCMYEDIPSSDNRGHHPQDLITNQHCSWMFSISWWLGTTVKGRNNSGFSLWSSHVQVRFSLNNKLVLFILEP
jgi:hypothetical protein